MGLNKLIIYNNVAGLHCECGNGEVITAENPDYKTFYYSWSTKSGHGTAVGFCKKCNSEMQEPEHRIAPASLVDDLIEKFGKPNNSIQEKL